MIDAAKVGRQIADLRKVKGLTQSQLGERLNISFQAVSKGSAAKLCRMLGFCWT